MKNKPQREVRYNFRRSDRNSECLEWYFLMIGDNQDIERMRRKIYMRLIPIVEEGQTYNGKKGNLKYQLIQFDSATRVDRTDIQSIHPNLVRDRTLYNRIRVDGLQDYLDDRFR